MFFCINQAPKKRAPTRFLLFCTPVYFKRNRVLARNVPLGKSETQELKFVFCNFAKPKPV